MWSLPVVFICENNKYGMSMSSEKAFKVEHLSEKAGGFGIPGETVDGNDVEAVHEAVARAVQRARAGEGPTLIEALTYRWRGHSKSDKNLYRTREEIAQWRADDPIAAYADVLLKRGEFTHEQLNAVTDEVRNEIREAVRFGTRGEEPTVEAMMQGIYAPSPVDARELGARA
jgi:pyruvate dehydrogenase E1 component alpha subunit